MKTLAEIEAAIKRLPVAEQEVLLRGLERRLFAEVEQEDEFEAEFRYGKLRHYLTKLEHRLARKTQWAVFEANDEQLWSRVRATMEKVLLKQWEKGALPGQKPEQAFFVRCDRSTMTQDDLDKGRLVCLVGVALLRPAEFVIFRIGQWTADRKP